MMLNLLWICCVVFAAIAVLFGVQIIRINKKNKSKKIIFDAISHDKNLAYVVLDSKSHIPVYISDNVCTLFGLERETIDADVTSLAWCMDKLEAEKFMNEFNIWDYENEFEWEFNFDNIDTKEKHYARALISVLEKKYIVVKIEEISKEIKWKDELRAELEYIKSEEQQKTDFLSTMSHEIRTPMNGILGMLTLARNNVKNPDEVLKYLEKAHSLSQFLLSIINDILDLSKIESGKIILEHERFDLLECLSRLTELFRSTIEEKGIRFEAIHENMDIRYVKGDSLRLMQVLTNLLSNASKYTNSGGEISLVFRQMNRVDGKVHMQFRVKDTGKGMNPEFLNRIFKPFEQESSSTTREYGGSGLGMAIADNMVRLMGGQIVVDTELGRGSEFSVYIPFDIAPGDQSLDDAVSEAAQQHEILFAGMRILMAEDNAINAEISYELFKMEGAELEIAENGKIAVEKVKNCPDGYYDIIFMDIQMPEMDGWTAAKIIRSMDREYTKTVPIYALSANAFTEDKRHSVEVGMNGHISKPIDFDELKIELGKSLNI